MNAETDQPMKIFKVYLAVLSFALISSSSLAQTANSNYVVIGAFRVLDNAVHYAGAANKMVLLLSMRFNLRVIYIMCIS